MGQPKELHEWQWSEDDPTTLRSSDITEISINQYGSLLAPFENGFRITDGDDDEPRSSSAPPGRSRDASPRSPGAGLAQLAYKRLGVRLSPTTRSISDPPLPGGEMAGGAFDDMEDELARWQRGEDQKNSAEGGPTEDELATTVDPRAARADSTRSRGCRGTLRARATCEPRRLRSTRSSALVATLSSRSACAG